MLWLAPREGALPETPIIVCSNGMVGVSDGNSKTIILPQMDGHMLFGLESHINPRDEDKVVKRCLETNAMWDFDAFRHLHLVP